MKILYFSEMIPINSDVHNIIFILNRLKELKKKDYIKLYPVRLNNILYSKRILRNYTLDLDEKSTQVKTINYIKIGYNGFFEYASNNLYKIYQKIHPNIVHIHFAFPEGYIGSLLKKKRGLEYILTVHGSDIHTIPFKGVEYRKKVCQALNDAKHVIFVSLGLLKTAVEIGYEGREYSIVPGGIDLNLFKPLNKANNSNKKVVGFIGNLNYIKGADRIPLIVQNTLKLDPRIKFEIIGEGQYRKFVERILSREIKAGEVKVTAYMPNASLPGIMSNWSIIIMPSRNEGAPTVLEESMAMGIPAVISGFSGAEELLDESFLGEIIKQDDSIEESFAEKITKLAGKSPGRESIVRYAQKFGIDSTISREIEIYKRYVK